MDNSVEFGIDPFLRDMEVDAKKAGFTQLMIIGIEFTKYTDILTEEGIKEELSHLQFMLNDGEDYTTDHEELSFKGDESTPGL